MIHQDQLHFNKKIKFNFKVGYLISISYQKIKDLFMVSKAATN